MLRKELKFSLRILLVFLLAAQLSLAGPAVARVGDPSPDGPGVWSVEAGEGEEIEVSESARDRFRLRVSAIDEFDQVVDLELSEDQRPSWPYRWSREEKFRYFNIGLAGATALYGLLFWDYGTSSFRFGGEGWFGADTAYGGADKTGHAWTTYLLCNVFNALYRYWGYEPEEAALRGTLSGLGMVTVVEIGDGFSRAHGFSWEDQLANTVGAGLAYLLLRVPELDRVVDFRMEWIPSPSLRHGDRSDYVTDYSGYKFLLAFKPGGLWDESPPALRYLEFHLGYFAHGFLRSDQKYFDEKTREVYVAVGINVTHLLETTLGTSAGRVFDFIQVPYTYLPAGKSWDTPYE